MNALVQYIKTSNNQVITTSEFISQVFKKRHDNVIQSIDNLLSEIPADFAAQNFKEITVEKNSNLGNGTIKSRAYELTKDGFMLLVMGFTGKQAMQIKISYIEAFNAMAEKLFSGSLKPDALKTKTALPNGLTLEQQDEIKKFHRELVQTAPKEKQAKLAIQLWSSVKSKFGVSYKEVAPEHYPEVLSLMARVAVEQNQALTGEVLDKLDKQQNPKLPHDYFAHLAKMAFYADHYLKIQELMCNNPNSKEAKSLADSLAFSSSTNPNQTGYLFVFKPNIKQDVTDAMSLLHDYSLMM